MNVTKTNTVRDHDILHCRLNHNSWWSFPKIEMINIGSDMTGSFTKTTHGNCWKGGCTSTEQTDQMSTFIWRWMTPCDALYCPQSCWTQDIFQCQPHAHKVAKWSRVAEPSTMCFGGFPQRQSQHVVVVVVRCNSNITCASIHTWLKISFSLALPIDILQEQ